MIRLGRLLCGVLVFGLISSLGRAETLPSKPGRYFNDYAGIVDPSTVNRLNETLAQFERDTSTQILVAIYRTMQSESSVADYTQRVAQTWGVGQKGRNNGAVLFVFLENRQMFIQTGYGLEGALPDAICFDITHNVIAPRFKTGDYAGGLEAGVKAIMQAVRGEYKGSGRTNAEGKETGPGLPFGIVLLVFLLIIIVMSRLQRKTRRGYGYSGWGGPYIGGFGGGSGGGWSSGSSSGSFSSFSGGGGSFGGGGAGSSW
jgi:uncharacterized protein